MSEKIESEIEKLVQESKEPVTIAFVRKKTGVSWPTARFVLLKLLAEGKIDGQALEPRGWIFWPKQLKQEIPVAK